MDYAKMGLTGRLLEGWRFTPAGMNAAGKQVDSRFWGRLIVNRSKTEADSWNFVCWGQQAELLNKYATVGKTLQLEGTPTQNNKKTDVVVDGKPVYQNYLELSVKDVVLGPDSEKVRAEKAEKAATPEKTPEQLLKEKAELALGPHGVELLAAFLQQKVEEQRSSSVSVEA